MSKTKITLAAIGGVSALAVLGAVVFAFIAFDSKSTCEEELQETIDEARKYVRQEIPPCAESKSAIDESCEQVKTWREEAFKLAARGDKPISPMSVAQFKEFMIGESHRIGALPQNSTNKIVDASFEFGPFKPYISDGKMPEEAELSTLQREFDDTVLILETLAATGVKRVKSFDLDDRGAAPKAEVQEATSGRARGRKGKAQPKKAKEEPETFKPSTHTYRVICLTTPAAFVKALNQFATMERYVVVDNFTLSLERDAIAVALGGADAKKEEAGSSRSRRRRAAIVEEEKSAEEGEAEAPKLTPVTDPATDAVFEAVLTISVHDFKTLEANESQGSKEEEAE